MEDSKKKTKKNKNEKEKEKKEYDLDDENELPDIIPAEKAPPAGTPIPKIKIENPQNPEDKKPPTKEKLISRKA